MNARAPARLTVEAGQPLDLLRAIRQIPKAVTRGAPVWTPGETTPRLPYLRRRAMALLQALRLRVDNKSMTWPVSKWGRGIALEQLAAEAGYSRSSGVRALRELEALGLVQTELRRPMRSRYTIVEARIVDLAQAHVTARGGRWEEVEPSGGVAGAPRWLANRAGSIGCSVEEAWKVMQFVVGAVFGGEARPEEYGSTARSVLRLWALRGRPDAAQFAMDVGVVAKAAAAAPGDLWQALRGGPNGRGRVRYRSLSALCRPAVFDERLELARAWYAQVTAASSQDDAATSTLTAEERAAAAAEDVARMEAILAEHEARVMRELRPAGRPAVSPAPAVELAPGPLSPASLADASAWRASVEAVIRARVPGWMSARVFLLEAAVEGAASDQVLVRGPGDPATLPAGLLAAVEAELGRRVVYEGRPPPG